MARDLLHTIGDVSVAAAADASEREGGTAQSLSARIVLGGDADVGVQVEALEHDGVGLGWRWRRAGRLGIVDVDVVTRDGDKRATLHRRLREGFARG